MRVAAALALTLAACAHGSPSGEPSAPAPGTAAAAPAPASGATPTPVKVVIARTWHGKVPTARADEYATYLAQSIVKFRQIPGNLGYEMMRETDGPVTHFMVVSFWTSRDAIHAYAGADISRTRFLPRDPEFLVDPESTVRNYDVVVQDLAK